MLHACTPLPDVYVSFSRGVQGRAGNSIPVQQGEEAGTAWAPHAEPTPTAAPWVQIQVHPASPRTSQLPWALSFTPPVLAIPLPSQGATRPPWDPPVPAAEWGVSRESSFYSHCLCCSLSRLLTTFSTQNFPVINIPAHGRKLAFLILLPCFSGSCFQQLALPAPAPSCFSLLLRDISGTQQNLLQHKDPKTPRKGSGSATSRRSGLGSSCTS